MNARLLRGVALGLLAVLLPACGSGGSGTLTPTVAPGIPDDVLARSGNQSVTIDWTASAQGSEYTVERSQLPNGPFFPVTVPGRFTRPTRYVDPELTNGTTYYYRIVAFNSFGQSAPSQTVSGTPGFKALAVNGGLDANNLALLLDGTVWEWGSGSFGVVAVPVQVPNLEDITAISGGSNNHLALAGDGRVWVWGSPVIGGPVPMPGLTDVIAVAAGQNFNFALTHDGIVHVWGDNSTGAFGTGLTTSVPTTEPQVVPGLTDIIAVDGGYDYGVAVRRDGLVFTWGRNGMGQCGRSSTGFAPLAVGQVPDLTGIIAISAGYQYCLALRNDGTVWGWGDNSDGNLGSGSNLITEVTTPTQAVNLSGVVRIVAGAFHSLAVLSDGTMRAWGHNFYGSLGTAQPGPGVYELSPVPVQGLVGIVDASATFANSIALGADGTVYSWGGNSQGGLGNGTSYKSHVPTELRNVTGTTAIAAGGYFNLIVRSPGSVWGFGYDDVGQLGTGALLDPPPADPVASTGISTATAVAAGYAHSLALDANTGTVWGWGDNTDGQVGTGLFTTPVLDPVPVATPSGITKIFCGLFHSLAIRDDQTLWSWGDNQYGQLGRPTPGVESFSPGQVPGLTGVVSAAGSIGHSVAVKSDGTVWVWGDNNIGELGLGVAGPTVETPTQIPGITTAVAAAAGYLHTIVLLNDGTLLSWGKGDRGQLGNVLTNSMTPLPIPGLTGVTAIAAGSEHNLALKSDGTVVAWGNNLYNQLGNPKTQFTLVPTPVQGIKDVVAISAGWAHNMVLLSNSTTWLWGNNEANELGVLYVDSSPTPVIISR